MPRTRRADRVARTRWLRRSRSRYPARRQVPHGLDGDGGERLVDLDQVQVGHRQAGLAQRLLDRAATAGSAASCPGPPLPRARRSRPGPAPRRQRPPRPTSPPPRRHHRRSARRCPAVMVPSRRTPAAARPATRPWCPPGRPHRCSKIDRLTAPLRDRHRHDLLRQQAVLDRPAPPAGATGRRTRPAAAAVMPSLALCRSVDSPMEIWSNGVGQPVVLPSRRAARSSRTCSPAGSPGSRCGALRHGLHAARHDHVELAGPDQLGGQRDRVQPGQADLVDGQGRHRHRDAPGHGRLPGR